MNVEILGVGTELLLGDIANTNAQFLSKELARLGIGVYKHTVVGDNEERLTKAFDDAFKSCDTVITTGGLGPTNDDLTKEVAAKYFNKELVIHEESLKEIEKYFNKQGKELKGSNKKQAYFPKDAIIFSNSCGTAPGAVIKGDENRTIIILPGPPREMQVMFKDHVIPYLSQFTSEVLVSKVLRIFGIGEGYMAEQIGDIIDKQTNPTVAPYAKDIDCILRITAKGKDENEANSLIKPTEDEIRQRLGDNIYGEGETSLEEVVAKILIDKKFTIATAESCTGGLLAGTLINYPGISEVFLEGAVTYSNEAKMRALGVKKETLDKYGAVSEETAKEMAQGIARIAGTNIGISTTGIAGPGGGTEEKPVGLVYVGICINGEVKVKKYNFQGTREKVRQRTVMNALDWLRRELK
ncbi:competence/damage-inducible protein cinA [Clostridium cavendishii DSM 21758]|uniref:Putative competence-damage inducible protein n=1 Tax=Clostridium cavendishii DSM 21758 TaxID=1121302 RepID=A0A1M6QUB2_9CLOT|nr:competence/damage-inducible protein A [Clostridium cavendishii]SHK23700.1 competence/damage-inducible protein cinA [Clostridium cavendishii DSM 21758]